MGNKHGSKSGSPQRRQPKPAPRNPHNISLSPEARRILDEGMVIAGRFESHSRLSRETLIERFVTLITRYGSETCWAALREAYSSKDRRNLYLCDPAFSALAKLGMLKEALTFMRRLQNNEGQRVAALSMMIDSANPETRALVLAKIEEIAAQTADPVPRLHAHYNLYQFDPERYTHLVPSLQTAYQGLSRRAERLTCDEARMLIGIGMFWTSLEGFKDLVLALERIGHPDARAEGEGMLFANLDHASRDKLNELADAVPGSRIEARLREMARVARTRQEQVDAISL